MKKSDYQTRNELNSAQKSIENSWAFETKAILVGQAPDPATGSTVFPIYQTATFTQAGISDNKGYVYSRTGNPTRTAAAEVLAALENAKRAFLYPSGIAAVHAVMQILKPGDHIITSSDLYGGSHRLFTKIMDPLAYEFDFVDAREVENIVAKINDSTKMIWLESPTNPLMRLCDIEGISKAIKTINLKRSAEDQILIGFDNTFASPYIQKPLELGVDIVIHSGTKYLGGHSDVLIGAVVCNNDELIEKFAFHQNATGSIAGPFDSWILMKGMKTLAVRMKQHNENALAIAEWLSKNSQIKEVFCPALKSNPQYDLFKRQMKIYNGMIAFEFNGSIDQVKTLVSETQIFQLAESLGGVESLICHPASMTHLAVPAERRKELGINDNLIRLSVGIENLEDLIKDLEQAFSKTL